MAKVYEIDNKLHAEFTSVGDVFRVIDKLDWKPQRDKSSDKRGNDGGFYSFKSLAEARDVFQNHPERIVNFSPNDEKLVRPDTIGKDVRFDVTGDYLDIDRHLEGLPESFGNAFMGNAKGMFCTINILTSYVSYTSKDYLIHRQKRITRLVDWLEQQEIRCQVVTTSDTTLTYMSVITKQFHDPFDVNELAIVSHPDWLRRIIFLVDEQSKTWSWGYGNSAPYDRRMMEYVPQPEDGMYIYVGGFEPYGNGIPELDWAFDQVEDQIQELIDNELTFNDVPFTVGDHRKSKYKKPKKG